MWRGIINKHKTLKILKPAFSFLVKCPETQEHGFLKYLDISGIATVAGVFYISSAKTKIENQQSCFVFSNIAHCIQIVEQSSFVETQNIKLSRHNLNKSSF